MDSTEPRSSSLSPATLEVPLQGVAWRSSPGGALPKAAGSKEVRRAVFSHAVLPSNPRFGGK